ncbi:MAG TPA: fructose-specific PTS transporter subunit EIIC [Actinomycetes bacterium]|nr:fructose-specific PTS transporter subunit EIIC [Actinomycetes bacterium]
MKIVAVTSCPTGIAHTYMAAEALEEAGRAGGHEIDVETQGAAGAATLADEVIGAADVVILAADVEVRNRERFAGKPTVTVSVKRAINDAVGVVAEAVRLAAAGPSDRPEVIRTEPAAKLPAGAGTGTQVRGWLMTGVSYLIPFVAAGGILIALSFMIGGYEIVGVKADIPGFLDSFSVFSGHDWAGLMFILGDGIFGTFLLPVLAGFIAYAIADRPGLAPGFVAGWAAGVIGAGFLGAIVGGLTGGLIALAIARIKVPSAVRGVMPVVVIPLFASLINGFLMLVVVGKPIATVTDGLNNWLSSLAGGSLILLGIILGLMMAFDMGGPVNKVAYAFAVTGLAEAATSASSTQLQVMATVMAAGMVPPLALALATVVRPGLFSRAERENGKAAWLLGASFITEGAIPFAAGDPLRVIPSIMAGSALTGGLVMAFGNELRAPHGGVWVFGLVTDWPLYVVAVAAGTALAAALVILLKAGTRSKDEAVLEAQEDAQLFATA